MYWLMAIILVLQSSLRSQGSPSDYSYRKIAVGSRLIPVAFREGHRYYFDVDNIKEDRTFKPIVVGLHTGSLYFAEYTENSDCTNFATFQALFAKCNGTYFVLQSDTHLFLRIPLLDVIDKKLCPMFEIDGNGPILVKYDVTDAKSPKYIGTYSQTLDRATIVDEYGKLEIYRDVAQLIRRKKIDPTKFEVFCDALIEDL